MLIEQTLEELEDEGVEFLTGRKWRSRLAISEENPQLVLDVMMPKGLMEVCRKVKGAGA
jgi:hypothetical protein